MGYELGNTGFAPAGPRGPGYGQPTPPIDPVPGGGSGVRQPPRIVGPEPTPAQAPGGGPVPLGPPAYNAPPTPTPKKPEFPDEGYKYSLPQPTPVDPAPPTPVSPQRRPFGGYTSPSGGGQPISTPGGYTPGRDLGSTPGPWRGPTGVGGNLTATGRYLPPPGTRPQPASDVYRRKDVLR